MAKTAKKDKVLELKAQLKEKKLFSLYVFYGDEEYLKEYYIKKIEALIPDAGLPEYNRIVISGRADYSEYDDVWESMPMMTDKRLVVIRDSNIFITRRSGDIKPPDDEQKEFWQSKFKRIAEDTVIIFCEKNVDARSALFKAASKAGFAVDFAYLSLPDLRAWIVRRVMKAGKKIDTNTADYLVSVIDPGLATLENELDKLINYCGEIVYRGDIEKVVSKALSVTVFGITEGIMEGNADKALGVLSEMKTQKQSVFGILYLIYSNVEKMLHLKMAGASSRNDAVSILGGSPWAAARYLDGARGFSMQELVHMVRRIPEIDYEIKSGRVTDWQALEDYVMEALEMRLKSRGGTVNG